MNNDKRFIEVSFPVKEVSKESAWEKIFVMGIFSHCISAERRGFDDKITETFRQLNIDFDLD